MRSSYVLAVSTLLLFGCGGEKNPYASNGTYGQVSNERAYGVVLSTQVGESGNLGSMDYQGTKNVAQSGATAAAPALLAGNVQSAVSSGSVGAYGTATHERSWLQSMGHYMSFGTGGNRTGSPSEVAIHYLIQKDNGQKIEIYQTPEIDEPILYPGQRCTIQYNASYIRVHPEDVERLFNSDY